MLPVGRDGNHFTLLGEAERLGASVLDLSPLGRLLRKFGIPDALVGFRGRLMFWEIKNPDTAYGRAGLTDAQKRFRAKWSFVPFFVITSVEDVHRALGVTSATQKIAR